jgi:RNA polymerase sigma-70 factor (ECF subfamily)
LALATLEPEHRAVLVAKYGRGMGVEAMASALGVREGTVKSRLSRARRKLRVAMERTV